jgi:dUTP pyrophosphatase
MSEFKEPTQITIPGIFKAVKIRYTKPVSKIKQIKNGDWIDLRCAEDVSMKAGDFQIIPLGVAMQLPEGCEALVAPRSSTFKKYGIIMANSLGIIDESYCGNDDEWGFPAYAVHSTFIPKDTRIAQFRLIKHQPGIIFDETDDLGNENRGGFGSTGEV